MHPGNWICSLKGWWLTWGVDSLLAGELEYMSSTALCGLAFVKVTQWSTAVVVGTAADMQDGFSRQWWC
jgi:hypothetical protein